MKLKKITAAALALAMCSSMLLTSCGGKSKGAGQGKEIEEMLEDTYGGRFTLTDTVAYRPGIYFIQSPVVSHYEYHYKWDQFKGEDIVVTTKDGGYQTTLNYFLYRPELEEYFTAELEKKFPGGVVAPYLCVAWGHGETELEEFDFDDALDEWELNYMCILAVDDVNDHKAIEKAIEEVFGDYSFNVEVHIASKSDVEDLARKVNPDKEGLMLYTYYENKLPSHDYYCYSCNLKVITGRSGWFHR